MFLGAAVAPVTETMSKNGTGNLHSRYFCLSNLENLVLLLVMTSFFFLLPAGPQPCQGAKEQNFFIRGQNFFGYRLKTTEIKNSSRVEALLALGWLHTSAPRIRLMLLRHKPLYLYASSFV